MTPFIAVPDHPRDASRSLFFITLHFSPFLAPNVKVSFSRVRLSDFEKLKLKQRTTRFVPMASALDTLNFSPPPCTFLLFVCRWPFSGES